MCVKILLEKPLFPRTTQYAKNEDKNELSFFEKSVFTKIAEGTVFTNRKVIKKRINEKHNTFVKQIF